MCDKPFSLTRSEGKSFSVPNSSGLLLARLPLNFGLPTYFVSHYCYGRALYAVFYSRAELFDCGVANDMSKGTHLLVGIMLTPCFGFVSAVCFSSFKILILSGFARDWCRFPSRLPYTSICLSIYFLEIDACIYPSLC